MSRTQRVTGAHGSVAALVDFACPLRGAFSGAFGTPARNRVERQATGETTRGSQLWKVGHRRRLLQRVGRTALGGDRKGFRRPETQSRRKERFRPSAGSWAHEERERQKYGFESGPKSAKSKRRKKENERGHSATATGGCYRSCRALRLCHRRP